MNDFSKLSAEDEMSRLAQVQSDELSPIYENPPQNPHEFDKWQAEVVRNNLGFCPDCGVDKDSEHYLSCPHSER